MTENANDSKNGNGAATDEEIVMVGPGAEAETPGDTDEADDERREQHADDDEGLGHAEADDDSGDEGTLTPEQRRKREERRKERKQRKERARERFSRDQTELRFLRERNEALERRQSETDARLGQTEIATIDSRINQIRAHIAQANEVIGKAITASKGEDAAEAQQIKSDLEQQLNQLAALRQRTIAGIQSRQGQRTAVNPRVKARAEQWMSEHSDWFDPKLGDEDSSIAYAVEQHLYKEGRLDPASDAYWQEVDRRVAKRLPHLGLETGRNSEDDERRNGNGNGHANGKGANDRPSGGPRFSTGGRERRIGKNEVYVSPERVEAMKAAGVWEDPALRAKYLKSYQKYDREARSRS